MKRLDQGHLHPTYRSQDWHVPDGNRTRASKSKVGGEASTPEKSHSNYLHMNARPVENARDKDKNN